MAEGIQVGDAVLKFVSDTTDLKRGFAEVDSTPARLAPATTAIRGMGKEIEVTSTGAREMGQVMDLAGKKTEFSMYEAKGEIGLLGEAIGVKLPRHVRSFVAELPGVGKAMTAAFEATAVLFLLQALIEMSQKLTEFISENYIFTEAMKESNKQVADGNVRLLEYSKQLKELKEAYILIGLTGVAKFREQIRFLNIELGTEKKTLAETKEELDKLSNGHEAFVRARHAEMGTLSRYWNGFKEMIGAADDAETAYQVKLGETQQLYIETTKKAETLEQKKKNLHKDTAMAMADEDMKLYERGKVIQDKLNHELEALARLEKEYAKIGYAQTKASEAIIDVTPMIVRDIEQWANALRTLGVTSIGQLTMKVEDEKKAVAGLEVLLATKHIGTLHDVHVAKLKLIQDEIALAKAQGNNTKTLEKQERDIKRTIPELQQYGKMAKSVADQVGTAITQTAFAWGQGSITITQALRQITASMISEVAKQAEVEGAKNLAKAFGDLGDYDFGAAGHHFAAAGAWFALAGGVSAAAGAVGGSSAKPGTASNPVNVTGTAGAAGQNASQPRAIGGVNHQSFAGGGLITKPTIALMGDRPGSKGEVAFDLDDKRSIDAIREAMGGGGGGPVIGAVHVKGLIDGNSLGKVIDKISKRVKKGQAHLTSSNSHRVTRRSV